jgi:lipid A 3-O-deacylase
MMKKTLLTALLAASLFPQLSMADPQPTIAVYAGAFEAFENNGNRATELGIEYRFAAQPSLLNLIPTLGLAMTADGNYWGYVGVRYDWQLNPKWTLTPHLAVAAYEEGGGLDLGHDMEFRTGLDLGYQLSQRSRLALGIHHMSNAYIGDHNPGSESIILTYSTGF